MECPLKTNNSNKEQYTIQRQTKEVVYIFMFLNIYFTQIFLKVKK